MDIFELTTRPNTRLFFKSYDSNDVRLGTIVKFEKNYFNDCRYVILGSPQDEGVKRNRGRVGAAEAPDTIRSVLYKMAYPKELESVGIFDLGNILTDGSLEEVHDRQTKVVEDLLNLDKIPIILGGGNDISYPDAKAVKQCHGSLFAINIDNHFDVRQNVERNSGTPYRMLLQENFLEPQNFVELGCQHPANSYVYKDYLHDKGVRIYYLDEIIEIGLKEVLDEISKSFSNHALFWGFDMDVIKAADAPGVSAITPIGLSGEDAIKIAKFAGKCRNTKLFEISEVNPKFDIDNRTTRLAALIIIHFINSNLSI